VPRFLLDILRLGVLGLAAEIPQNHTEF